MKDIQIDINRIKNILTEIGSIGRDSKGGISRVFGSTYITEAQAKVKAYMEDAGLSSWIDPIGNVHGILKSTSSTAKTVLVGSHIDTVDNGGLFDGMLGVVAAVECARTLEINNTPLENNIHIIATNGEEGNDLGGTLGSRAMMGIIDLEDAKYLDKAKTYGYSKEDFLQTRIEADDIKCFMELHIEQGPTLDTNREDIGIVTGIVGLERYSIEIFGVSNHAGTTMMEYREDALVEASKIVLKVNELAKEIGHSFVATVGRMDIFPNAVAVIPGKVTMILEIRNQRKELMDSFMKRLKEYFPEGDRIQYTTLVKKDPVECSPTLVQTLEEICQEENVKFRRMPSGATHDGNALALKMPIAMVFVPSKDGISHNPAEWTSWEQIHRGVNILYKMVKEMGLSNEAIGN